MAKLKGVVELRGRYQTKGSHVEGARPPSCLLEHSVSTWAGAGDLGMADRLGLAGGQGQQRELIAYEEIIANMLSQTEKVIMTDRSTV